MSAAEVAACRATADEAAGRGDHASALEALRRALALLGPAPPQAERVDDTSLHVLAAGELERAGRAPAAEALLRCALEERLGGGEPT